VGRFGPTTGRGVPHIMLLLSEFHTLIETPICPLIKKDVKIECWPCLAFYWATSNLAMVPQFCSQSLESWSLAKSYLSEEVDIVNPPFRGCPVPPLAICYEVPADPLSWEKRTTLIVIRCLLL
jgi:hypothetical protein